MKALIHQRCVPAVALSSCTAPTAPPTAGVLFGSGSAGLGDISDTEAEEILVSDYAAKCEWLSGLRDDYLADRIGISRVKEEILRALFTVGLVGWKDSTNQVVYSFDEVVALDDHKLDSAVFILHKMFWTALGVHGD